jgi:excisionase family DNA binding protein
MRRSGAEATAEGGWARIGTGDAERHRKDRSRTPENSKGTVAQSWELWTWREVAQALKFSRSWVCKKVETGELPSLRLGGELRFDPEVIRRWALTADQRGKVLPLPTRDEEV